ncbi:MAG: M55 family metallopeptidase [Deltaproteobacteria bacterium]|nr:M55 family metallopeptidase [Deltaproteobacteria bacterium]
MTTRFDHILIIADIEGSSGCWDYRASKFMTNEWSRACVEMTLDVNAVVRGLFAAGVKQVTVKDFHRTGYNLLPEMIDPMARVVLGYRQGPVPGLGNPGDAEAVMFLGMHAASGTEGFMAHTLTSRIIWLEVNGKPLAEVELFSASLAPYGIRPIFFSGCPTACAQAQAAIRRINSYPIDKSDGPALFDAHLWRSGLVNAALESLNNLDTEPYLAAGPFRAEITMWNGESSARKLAQRWGFAQEGSRIFIEAADIHELYSHLIRLCYLTPLTEKMLPWGLSLYNLTGRLGLEWVRWSQRSVLRRLRSVSSEGHGVDGAYPRR